MSGGGLAAEMRRQLRIAQRHGSTDGTSHAQRYAIERLVEAGLLEWSGRAYVATLAGMAADASEPGPE